MRPDGRRAPKRATTRTMHQRLPFFGRYVLYPPGALQAAYGGAPPSTPLLPVALRLFKFADHFRRVLDVVSLVVAQGSEVRWRVVSHVPISLQLVAEHLQSYPWPNQT